MKTTISRSDLSRVLKVSTGVIGTEGVMSSLHFVASDDGGATITAGNGNAWNRAKIEANTEQPGDVLIPHEWLAQVVGDSRSDKVTIMGKDTSVWVGFPGEDDSFSKTVEPTNQYPKTKDRRLNRGVVVKGAELADAIDRVEFAAASQTTTLPALTAIKIEVDDTFNVIATDGRRIAVADIDCEGTDLGESAMIPAGLTETVKMMARSAETVTVSSNKSCVKFKAGESELLLRLSDDSYPDWKRIIPDTTGHSQAKASVGLALAKIQQASVMSRGNKRAMEVAFGLGNITVRCVGEDVGDAKARFTATSRAKAKVQVLSYDQMRQFLSVLDPESSVELRYKEGHHIMHLESGRSNYWLCTLAGSVA